MVTISNMVCIMSIMYPGFAIYRCLPRFVDYVVVKVYDYSKNSDTESKYAINLCT